MYKKLTFCLALSLYSSLYAYVNPIFFTLNNNTEQQITNAKDIQCVIERLPADEYKQDSFLQIAAVNYESIAKITYSGGLDGSIKVNEVAYKDSKSNDYYALIPLHVVNQNEYTDYPILGNNSLLKIEAQGNSGSSISIKLIQHTDEGDNSIGMECDFENQGVN